MNTIKADIIMNDILDNVKEYIGFGPFLVHLPKTDYLELLHSYGDVYVDEDPGFFYHHQNVNFEIKPWNSESFKVELK